MIKKAKKLVLLGALSTTSHLAHADVFWSLYLIVREPLASKEESYIPLSSFKNRAMCEESIKSASYVVAETTEFSISLRCLKTDEPAGFPTKHLDKNSTRAPDDSAKCISATKRGAS